MSFNLPCGSAQQSLDHDIIDGVAPELLYKGWLVEGDTGRHHFVYDSLALIKHFRTKPRVWMLAIMLSVKKLQSVCDMNECNSGYVSVAPACAGQA